MRPPAHLQPELSADGPVLQTSNSDDIQGSKDSTIIGPVAIAAGPHSFVMLNLFQHPRATISRAIAADDRAWTLKQVGAYAVQTRKRDATPAKAGAQLGNGGKRALRLVTSAFPTAPRRSV
jgi:hypothetical protein